LLIARRARGDVAKQKYVKKPIMQPSNKAFDMESEFEGRGKEGDIN
jgi:hypothetical protein